jgi:hypothetical protein
LKEFVPGPWRLGDRETAMEEMKRLQALHPDRKYRVRKVIRRQGHERF